MENIKDKFIYLLQNYKKMKNFKFNRKFYGYFWNGDIIL